MPPASATVISNIIDTLGNVPSVQLFAQLVHTAYSGRRREHRGTLPAGRQLAISVDIPQGAISGGHDRAVPRGLWVATI